MCSIDERTPKPIPVIHSETMQKNKYNSGFTLIELLVVIAIIGILSAVVLASLSSSRSKAHDAAVKVQMKSIMAKAELLYSGSQCYAVDGTTCSNGATIRPTAVGTGTAGSTCNTVTGLANAGSNTFSRMHYDDGIATQLAAIRNNAYQRTTTPGTGIISCAFSPGGTSYVIAAVLRSDNTKFWCIDSNGFSGEKTSASAITADAQLNSALTSGYTACP